MEKIVKNNIEIVIIEENEINIKQATSAIDAIMDIKYQTNCSNIVIDKKCISEDFFQLSTGLAGEVFQKLINYHIKLAIVGDFSMYTSKALKDFIYESNKGKAFFFVETQQQAIEKLCDMLGK
ncbi:DUF4180 domain-containing protein [Clostridium sp. MD294]|uniref:DUF4180 domain-containing protein n=1 Tax=Clostridium sp. MD294 TaxID=97138 RepID=UPI0002C8AA9B|nr:DUF4180 domain-containing protein [Clostridium sp. MD294]USF29479.1 hypothetical protein C820_000870 [Clostridium sp. MD294]